MPIDANIALGVRPIEQPNMLGQMGQFMAIKAAQQEMEGYEGVKNALAGGMDASDPRLLQYGKRGIEAFRAAGEGKIKQLEAGKKQSELLGNIFGGVMQDPSSGPAAVAQLVKMNLIKPEEAQQVMAQAGNDPEAWKKIASPYYQQSIDATKRFQDETERWKANLQAQVTREGHGVQMYGHNVTKQNNQYNQANPTQHFFTDENGNLSRVPTRGAGGATQVPIVNTLAPQMGPVVNNMTAPGQGATAPVSAMPPANVPLSQIPPAAPQQFAKVAQTGTMAGYERLPDGTMRAIPGGPADTAAKAPEGYRRTPDGNLEFIKGGPKDPNVQAQQAEVKLSTKDIAAREAKYPQATTALNGFEAKTAKFERDIDELLANKKGLDEITGYIAGRTNLSAMSKEGQRALALYNTITAKGGFSELQDMRNASPTGGALGNVSNQEGQQLINSFGALARTQNAEDLRRSLATAKSDLQGSKQRIKEAYDLTYEYKNSSAGSKPNAAKEDPLGIR